MPNYKYLTQIKKPPDLHRPRRFTTNIMSKNKIIL